MAERNFLDELLNNDVYGLRPLQDNDYFIRHIINVYGANTYYGMVDRAYRNFVMGVIPNFMGIDINAPNPPIPRNQLRQIKEHLQRLRRKAEFERRRQRGDYRDTPNEDLRQEPLPHPNTIEAGITGESVRTTDSFDPEPPKDIYIQRRPFPPPTPSHTGTGGGGGGLSSANNSTNLNRSDDLRPRRRPLSVEIPRNRLRGNVRFNREYDDRGADAEKEEDNEDKYGDE